MNRIDKYSAIRDIVDAICTNNASQDQIETLEYLLKGNIEAQHFYYDYMSMHAQMLSGPDRNMEFVYRRMTEVTRVTEEIFVRSQVENPLARDDGTLPSQEMPYKFWLIILSVVCLVTIVIWYLFNRPTELFYAEMVQGSVSTIENGYIEDGAFFAGEFRFDQDSTIKLRGGNKIQVAAHSIIKLFNHQELALSQGRIKLESSTLENIIIHGPNFSLHSNSSSLSVEISKINPVIKSGKNTLLIPSRWQPNHFWTFDGQSDRVIDSVSSAYGIPGIGATRVIGLVGQGAYMFDNSKNAHVTIGSGGGNAPATGSFSVTDGVTIEALVRTNYSGKSGEIDHIFRKGGNDKELRVLLSFQNDIDVTKNYLSPDGKFEESLSFGLFVVGHGYQELKLPLDGLEGRPTLAQLKQADFNHVAATYSVSTGLKAIYINGVQLAAYQYPAGSKVLSGGPGLGAIGNNPAWTRWEKGAFAGVIDEVAFYNFALPAFTLQQHLKQVRQGLNYFGMPPSYRTLPKKLKIPLPEFQSIQLDPLTGLPMGQDHHEFQNAKF